MSAFKRALIPILLALGISHNAAAYSPGSVQNPSTHPLLTKRTAQLYQQSEHGRAKPERHITESKLEAMMRGSIAEDSPQAMYVRAYNHFTDWQSEQGIFGFPSSMAWAVDPDAQSGPVPTDNLLNLGSHSWSWIVKAKYESMLAEYDGLYPEGDHSWQQVLSSKSLESLGHLLHLIQDASVPAHVLNDPHPGLSDITGLNWTETTWSRFFADIEYHEESYEMWAAENNHRIAALQPNVQNIRAYDSLFDIFSEMVAFTGSNFYSDNRWEKPSGRPNQLASIKEDCVYVPEKGKNICKTYYVRNINGQEVAIARKGYFVDYVLDDKVLSSQYQLLATKAIEVGASLTRFFFESIEQGCFPQQSLVCYNNNVYNVDSCGNRETTPRQSCTSTQRCDDGRCIDIQCDECSYSGELTCQGDYTTTCVSNNGCLEWQRGEYCSHGCSQGTCQEESCSNECSSSGRSCSGNNVVDCGYVDSDDCLDRSVIEYCSSGCSNGRCIDTPMCSNECSSSGQRSCSANSVGECGDFDDDLCLDYQIVETCSFGCRNGQCEQGCFNECSTSGQRSCSGNNVQECGDFDDDPCLEYRIFENCGNGCRNGQCTQSCTNECSSAGQRSCSGNSVQECGDFDADSCLEYGIFENCGNGCSNGQCICSNECSSAGQRSCSANSVLQCGNIDADSCLEYGIIEYCSHGCSQGVCLEESCTNECSSAGQRSCSGNSVQECGDFDLDDCMEYRIIETCSNGCSNGACVGQQTCNPAAGGSDSGCIFYDNFNGSSLDTICKWYGPTGQFTQSNGTATLGPEEGSLTRRDTNLSDCTSQNNYSDEIRISGGTNGKYKFFSGSSLFWWYDIGNYFVFDCRTNTNYEEIPNFSASDYHSLKVHHQDDSSHLYIDGILVASLLCPPASAQSLSIVNFSPQNSTYTYIDWVKTKCN